METIAVMMSTYNGEKYIEEQIESIINQQNIIVTLYIRDDGSKDNTRKILKEYESRYNNIYVEYSENIGWKKSFFSILNTVPLSYDYFAFSDQDDVWMLNKLVSATQIIKENKGTNIKLYCSNQTFVNEQLEEITLPVKKKFRNSNEYHVIVNGYGMGCTEVFSRELIELYRQADIYYEEISHDVMLSVLATYFGSIYRDENSYMLYRQHPNNTGNKHRSFIKKLSMSFDFTNVFVFEMANFINDNYSNELTIKQRKIINCFVNMNNPINKIKLILNKYVSKDTFFGTLKVKTYVLCFRRKK